MSIYFITSWSSLRWVNCGRQHVVKTVSPGLRFRHFSFQSCRKRLESISICDSLPQMLIFSKMNDPLGKALNWNKTSQNNAEHAGRIRWDPSLTSVTECGKYLPSSCIFTLQKEKKKNESEKKGKNKLFAEKQSLIKRKCNNKEINTKTRKYKMQMHFFVCAHSFLL